jgi:predicted Zn-dependent protease
MVAGALIEGVAASQGISTNGQLTQSATDIGTIVYSTEFEREADYIGLYIAARAGYDPHKAIHYWRRLSVHEPSSINGGLTHPSNPSRFVAMQKTIAEIEAKQRSRLLLLPEVTRKN